MRRKVLSLAVCLLVSSLNLSCAMMTRLGIAESAGGEGQGVVQPGPLAAVPAPVAPSAPAETAAEQPGLPLAGPQETQSATAPALTAEVRMGQTAHTLTEALDRALEMLTKEKEQNELLRQNVEGLQKELVGKHQAITSLTLQLQTAGEKVVKLEDALDKWKHDVLGYRDEMRTAEEAEIDVLQEILMVLKSLRQDEELQPEGRS